MKFGGVKVVSLSLREIQLMDKISAIWQLFKVGSSVSNPELWKKRQIKATVLGAVILAIVNLLAAFGHSIPIDTTTANSIAGGILAVINVVLTITTTDKIGMTDTITVEGNDEPTEENNTVINDKPTP